MWGGGPVSLLPIRVQPTAEGLAPDVVPLGLVDVNVKTVDAKDLTSSPISLFNLKRTATISSSGTSSGGDEFHPRLYPKVKRRSRSASKSNDRRRSSSRRGSSKDSPQRHRSKPRAQKATSSKATSTTRASSTRSVQTLSHAGDQDVDADGNCVYGGAEGEAAIVAEKVRALPDPLEAAWSRLRAEFQTQASIWESLAMLRRGMSGDSDVGAGRTERPMLKLQKQIETILDDALKDYVDPIEDLEALMQNDKYADYCSRPFQLACDDVIQAEVVSARRQQLIEYLEEDPDENDASQLETLLRVCEIDDLKLDFRIRQVLRLGLRSALHHVLPEHPESLCEKKRVRFDFRGDDWDIPDQVTTNRFSDGVYVREDGVVRL